MFFTTKFKSAGGITIRRFHDEYHLFTTVHSIDNPNAPQAIYHAVSNDLEHWEDCPNVIEHQTSNSFEGHTLYDVDAFQKENQYYFFYTGLDIRGAGQKQAIGLALSEDKKNWQRYQHNPILKADPNYYEDSIPDTSCYQEKDQKRQWFRDPWIHWDKSSQKYYMAVGARCSNQNPDTNACIAWASSNDLVNWKNEVPLFAPERFHTMEVPVIIEKDNLHYLFYLTHPNWGYPIISTDPYQRYGNYYAYSENGLMGPYQTPEDEIVLCSNANTRPMRTYPLRVCDDQHGNYWAYYHLLTFADTKDEGSPPEGIYYTMPLPKQVRFCGNGNIELMCNNKVLKNSEEVDLSSCSIIPHEESLISFWKKSDDKLHGKNFKSIQKYLYDIQLESLLIQADITFLHGIKAGFIFRSQNSSHGLQVTLNRNFNRVEFGVEGESQFIDARSWNTNEDQVELKVVAIGPSIEIYVNDKLMVHQIRYKERIGNAGIFVDESEVFVQNLKIAKLANSFPK